MTLPHYSRNRVLSDGKHYSSPYTIVATPGFGLPALKSGIDTVYHETKRAAMSDCINPYGSRGFRSPGPCSSYKVVRDGQIGHVWSWGDATNHGIPLIQKSTVVSRDHYDLEQIVSFLPHVPISIVQDNRIASAMKSITQVPTEISIANFAVELLEWQKTFEHYQKAVTKGGLRMKDVPGWANSTLLDYSFNLSPFIGDIGKMFTVWGKVVSRIEFLLKNRGKLVRQSFYNPDLWSNNPNVGQEIHRSTVTPPYGDGGGTIEASWMGETKSTSPTSYGYRSLRLEKYHASFSSSWYLYQTLEGLDDAWASLRGLIAGLGLNNPAKIVWNAVPFSFVADWMFPFGSLLDRLAVQPFAGHWEIFDMVNSIKENAHIVQDRVYLGGDLGNTKLSNGVNVQRYTRSLGADINVSDIDLTDFDQKQQLLLASLIAGNTLFRSGSKHAKKHK